MILHELFIDIAYLRIVSNWAPSLELESLEGRVATRNMVANGQVSKLALGYKKRPPNTLKYRRREISSILKEDFETKRIVGLGNYAIQGKWLAVGIDNLRHKDLTWQKLLYQCSPRLVKFLVNAIPNLILLITFGDGKLKATINAIYVESAMHH